MGQTGAGSARHRIGGCTGSIRAQTRRQESFHPHLLEFVMSQVWLRWLRFCGHKERLGRGGGEDRRTVFVRPRLVFVRIVWAGSDTRPRKRWGLYEGVGNKGVHVQPA